MATTHVFVVDTTTLKCHLEFMFAGTGSKDDVIDFNDLPTSGLWHSTERNLVALIADSQRIRKGDLIIFYLQQNLGSGVREGKFYGVFRVTHDLSFLDNNDAGQYLKSSLAKSLTLRTIIEPLDVYPQGVTEWEALDEIKHIQSPNQMLWSLIYRKLKGNRGNTMITIYEAERLIQLIRDKNGHQPINYSSFTFDVGSQEIAPSNLQNIYSGRREPIDILPRLRYLHSLGRAFEIHFQAWIIQQVGRGTCPQLDALLLSGMELEWLGMEVSCGVGMQRIDMVLSLAANHRRKCLPIELKSVEASEDAVLQMQRYVDWLSQYYIPNRPSDMEPMLIALRPRNRSQADEATLRRAASEFKVNNPSCLPLKIIEYTVEPLSIDFTQLF